ncbi:MAG TPA: multidrug effflux MFS transporter [Alphaproteobacteria bacterium]|nr:multidrug effflux MFS transporter [Alphaproteobacteria bacterium]
MTASKFLLFVLVALTALGPMSMQIFLPALPAIRTSYGVSAATAQLTLSVSMLAIALATLIYGPLSDRYGRRPIVIIGLFFFLAGSALCAAAPDIWTLIVGRMLQGAGGASGMVLARAIVRDLYDRDRSASVIAYLTTAMVIAPMLSPTIGGVLTDWASWRASFVFAGCVGLGVTALVLARLPETHTEREPIEGLKSFFGGFGHLLAQPIFCGYVLHASFVLGVFFAFMSGAPYIMVDVMKRPATEYGLYFFMVSAGFMLGGLTAGRISAQVGIDRMIVLGGMGSLITVAIGFAIMASGVWHPLALFGPAMFASYAAGISMPNAQAGAISVNPKAAGAASGLAGFVQMFIGAGVAQAVGTIQNGTPYPMLGTMLACSVLALAAIVLPLWYHRRATGTA